MEWKWKSYEELDKDELLALLQARQDIFVVEQSCAYADIDGRDKEAVHVFCLDEDGSAAACLRLVPKRGEEGTVHMGRVLTRVHGRGLGAELLRQGVRCARERMGAQTLYVEAQSYAVGFYAREGLQIAGEEFVEDGIPHIPMRMTLR